MSILALVQWEREIMCAVGILTVRESRFEVVNVCFSRKSVF